MPVVTSCCETVYKNQGIQHCCTPSLVILNGDNDSVPTSHKTTHKDPAATFMQAIMHIKWQERVPDVEVLKWAGTVSTEAYITVTQLRWAGHVSRMPDN